MLSFSTIMTIILKPEKLEWVLKKKVIPNSQKSCIVKTDNTTSYFLRTKGPKRFDIHYFEKENGKYSVGTKFPFRNAKFHKDKIILPKKKIPYLRYVLRESRK